MRVTACSAPNKGLSLYSETILIHDSSQCLGGVIMTVKMLGCAVLAALLAVSAAEARSVAQIGGPANPPPASYKGQQFVDSRGCLFLRAGSGRNVNWVSRIDTKRKPICGMWRGATS